MALQLQRKWFNRHQISPTQSTVYWNWFGSVVNMKSAMKSQKIDKFAASVRLVYSVSETKSHPKLNCDSTIEMKTLFVQIGYRFESVFVDDFDRRALKWFPYHLNDFSIMSTILASSERFQRTWGMHLNQPCLKVKRLLNDVWANAFNDKHANEEAVAQSLAQLEKRLSNNCRGNHDLIVTDSSEKDWESNLINV